MDKLPLYAEIDRLRFLEDTRLEARDALEHIVAMADKYPEAMLPTPLLVAIEAGRRVVG